LPDATGRCALSQISVTADATLWIPRWVNEREAPAGVRDIVNAFLRRVEAHERGHVDIHVEAGQEIVGSLRAIAPARSCQQLRAEAEMRVEAIMHRSRARQLDYDVRTRRERAP
jgi:predicted secreted Zn-dependent protease